MRTYVFHVQSRSQEEETSRHLVKEVRHIFRTHHLPGLPNHILPHNRFSSFHNVIVLCLAAVGCTRIPLLIVQICPYVESGANAFTDRAHTLHNGFLYTLLKRANCATYGDFVSDDIRRPAPVHSAHSYDCWIQRTDITRNYGMQPRDELSTSDNRVSRAIRNCTMASFPLNVYIKPIRSSHHWAHPHSHNSHLLVVPKVETVNFFYFGRFFEQSIFYHRFCSCKTLFCWLEHELDAAFHLLLPFLRR
mmetsp:Transcript_20931/g.37288  ORF Transcript_20931/g.37288 Transcript_20931/m.37288 type:complete len:248 (+) Transcript_20931:370-1113(+)